VAAVVGLIVVTSTIGIINPLLIQVVFNKALFVPGGPNLHLLVILVAIMAVVPIVNGAIGILQTCETTRVGQLVMRDLRDRLYSHLQTLPLAFFTGTKTGEIQSRLANDVGGVQPVVTTTAPAILANVVIFVSTIVAMVILSWQLTIVAVFTVPVFFWLTKMAGERRRQVARSTQESLAAMSALSEEPCRCPGCCWPRCSATRRATPPATTRTPAPGRPGSPPADDRPRLLRHRAVVPVDHPGCGLPDRRPAAGARHGHLRGHRRRVHHAADPPVLSDRAAAAGLSGAPIVPGLVRPDLRVPGRDARHRRCPRAPSICRRSAVAAGWLSGKSTSATPARRWTR